MVADLKFEEIKVGDTASFSKTVSEADVYAFAGISGDFNPIHVDAEFARGTRFGQRIAHGILTASLVSTVIGTALPGKNTIYLSQDLRFVAPVFFGDTLTAMVKVAEILPAKRILVLETTVVNQHGKQVLTGQAKVMKQDG
ncbi:MAG: MaoC family dehydratase [Syntrophomonadaceae bacterium]|jgi:3-hydroxybutyryl-CoA dehydratase|nr:MaoC family dehydratase [Syntrophomonadaceae bacterium]